MGTRAGRDTASKRKIPSLCRDSNSVVSRYTGSRDYYTNRLENIDVIKALCAL